ncbi:hypothetical protein [Mesorhizobium sp. M0013]|uniref:hypothetical protein n=1 Tax=Mesorhizobium sp. M0013 TaxID=2956841 RepID=UPI003337CB79
MAEQVKKTLPQLDIKTGINHSPHVVILGAGASRACCPIGDKNGQKLPVMSDLVVKLGIEDLITEAGHDPAGNFEAIYSAISASENKIVLERLDDAVRRYFSALVLPDEPSLYDYLVLSLRPKDLIVTFNWDPLLPQAYRRWRHLGNVLPQIAFLHGNVDISVDIETRRARFTSDLGASGEGFKPSRLLYPVAVKDYNSDPFTKDQWDLALWHMRHAYYVTVYGYSAPQTDVEARQLLLDAWKNNTTQTLAEFDVVDIAPRAAVEASWSEFIVRTHGSILDNFEHNILKLHPRRSCEAFAFATLQQAPWHEDPFPTVNTLEGLEDWVRPILLEEGAGLLKGEPHH